jgi:hypothetical protein
MLEWTTRGILWIVVTNLIYGSGDPTVPSQIRCENVEENVSEYYKEYMGTFIRSQIGVKEKTGRSPSFSY